MGYLGDELVGYALGFRLRGLRLVERAPGRGRPRADARTAPRTVAICEIMVREPFRRCGYARQLHDAFLRERTEARATLLVDPTNTPARTAYLSWGWQRPGGVRPFADSPTYDGMILDLPHSLRS